MYILISTEEQLCAYVVWFLEWYFFRLEHIIVHANALIVYCKSVIIVFKNVTLTKI